MTRQLVLTDLTDNVLTVTINRADRMNAVDRATAKALLEVVTAARTDDEVRAIILTGTGRGFCAGADLTATAEQPAMTRATLKAPIQEYTDLTAALDAVDKPVIAAVNGAAVGAGLSYALACDRRIAAESARFAAIFVKRGLAPDCGLSYFLPRIVGVARATDMVITGDILDAKRALAIGLVDEVVPDDELMERARAYAGRIAAGASVAIDLARRAVRRSFEHTLETAMAFESWAQGVATRTADVQEGRRAFIEKREPRFVGQ